MLRIECEKQHARAEAAEAKVAEYEERMAGHPGMCCGQCVEKVAQAKGEVIKSVVAALHVFGDEAHGDHISAVNNSTSPEHYHWLRGRCQGVYDAGEKVKSLLPSEPSSGGK